MRIWERSLLTLVAVGVRLVLGVVRIECKIIEEEKEIFPAPIITKIETVNHQKEKYNPAIKPLFKNNFERYEYLMNYGCTCATDRTWLSDFKNSKEYEKYEKDFCENKKC